MLHNKIRVTSIQRLCVNDGPGVRTVVFLKGCYLECPWCCNPETIHYENDEYFKRGKCLETSIVCAACRRNDEKINRENCLLNFFEKTFHDYTIDELYDILLRDISIYDAGGGITFSGGEPLLQATQILPLLQKIKQKGISLAIETTLYAPIENYTIVYPYIDFWIIDLKFQYGFIRNKDYNINRMSFYMNLKALQQSTDQQYIIYRMVVMSEILDKIDIVAKKLCKYNIALIELLPCHSLAKNKYKELGKTFHQFGLPTMEELSICKEQLLQYSILSKFHSL